MNGKGGERNIKIKIVLMMIIICTIIFVISVAIFTKELLEYTETSEKNIQLIEEVVCETNDKVILMIGSDKEQFISIISDESIATIDIGSDFASAQANASPKTSGGSILFIMLLFP